DFPLARITQEQLDLVLRERVRVETIYRLSPMQQGMLFHTLYAPGAGEYISQLIVQMDGDLNLDALANAWQAVIERHQMLQASFHGKERAEPVQVVHEGLDLPLTHEDWRGHSEAARSELLEDYLGRDRADGFDLEKAPLMRMLVIRTGESRYQLVWSWHHVLL